MAASARNVDGGQPEATSSEPSTAAAGSPFDLESRAEDVVRPVKLARRAFLTQHACARCRHKKSKCDGKRPVCARCARHGTECAYEVAQEGMTRMQHLQRKLDECTQSMKLVTPLLQALRNGSDELATTLLARWRLGESMEDLVASLRDAPEAVPFAVNTRRRLDHADPMSRIDNNQEWTSLIRQRLSDAPQQSTGPEELSHFNSDLTMPLDNGSPAVAYPTVPIQSFYLPRLTTSPVITHHVRADGIDETYDPSQFWPLWSEANVGYNTDSQDTTPVSPSTRGFEPEEFGAAETSYSSCDET